MILQKLIFNIMVQVATLFTTTTKIDLDDSEYIVTIKDREYTITLTQRITFKNRNKIKQHSLNITYDEYL